MKICRKCVLPETFPGIRFNDEGECNYCQDFKGKKNLEQRKLQYRSKFEKLILEYKGKANYDALLSYSGGKDSTYTLSLLKKQYGLKILVFTFDNGFLPDQTFRNIRNVVEKLGVDHIFFKPNFHILRKIFLECSKKNIFPDTTLSRASTICTACMAIVKFSALRLALEKGIPFMIYGWSPGQIPITSSIMKNNAKMVRVMQESLARPLFAVAGDDIKPYFLENEHFREHNFFLYNISPLAFLNYDETMILKEMAELGWKAPPDVDANSTNCLLNSFANVVHKERYGFHPYAFELAKLVREGYKDREHALIVLRQREKYRTYNFVSRKLKEEEQTRNKRTKYQKIRGRSKCLEPGKGRFF
ncbi:MAG: phosphoadenosine phosphosulfate reductase family protein [Clostridiales bacterium]|nr:phosphoadenosine phosphosulfate reductase family protein [Clostridiales bacterium]